MPGDYRTVKIESLNALVWSSDAGSTPFILDALKDTSAEVRKAAVEALGKRGDTTVIDDIIAMVHDKNTSVRTSAISALILYPQPRHVPLLKKVHSTDPDDSVRNAAGEALLMLLIHTKSKLLKFTDRYITGFNYQNISFTGVTPLSGTIECNGTDRLRFKPPFYKARSRFYVSSSFVMLAPYIVGLLGLASTALLPEEVPRSTRATIAISGGTLTFASLVYIFGIAIPRYMGLQKSTAREYNAHIKKTWFFNDLNGD